MIDAAVRHERAPVGIVPLWFGLVAGPAAWTAQLALGYMWVSLACESGRSDATWPLHALTLAALALALAGGAVAYSSLRRARSGRGTALAAERSAFMARSGLLVSGLFLLAIVAADVGAFVLGLCEKGHG